MRGQIVADFIVEHRFNDKHGLEVGYITCTPWKLYFDGSVCDDGQRIGVVLISPNGAVFEFLNRLEEECTNNQVEYEVLLFGLKFLQSMGVKHVEAFGDSLLVVQQVSKVYQCYNGSLNAYLDKCLDIISSFDEFIIKHIPMEENGKANTMAQQASGYNVTKKYFNIRKPIQTKDECLVLDAPVRPVSETGLTGNAAVGSDSAKKDDSIVLAEAQDWRVPLTSYLRDPGRGAERNIRRLAFKYVLIDDELYRRTAEDLLLKCLDLDHARVAMGKVHEGICGTHQSAPKMKWLLRRAGFYWPTMLSD
jgi:ribonuclease HI